MKRNKNKLIDSFDKALAERVVLFFSVVIFQGVAQDSEVKWPLREDWQDNAYKVNHKPYACHGVAAVLLVDDATALDDGE